MLGYQMPWKVKIKFYYNTLDLFLHLGGIISYIRCIFLLMLILKDIIYIVTINMLGDGHIRLGYIKGNTRFNMTAMIEYK